MEDKIQMFKKLVTESNSIVFFGGAGVSTESGIPDFRSEDGLYNQQYKYPPETLLSHNFFINNTEAFYAFYKTKMNSLNYAPNITHIKLAQLENLGKLKAIVTQNIDGLHQKAGAKVVYELHGSILRNYCMKCNKFYDADYVFNCKDVHKCNCGGIIKPDVVLYQEGLDDEILNKSVKAIANADMLIVAGTSLTVQPASSLINYYMGNKLILINKEPTPYDTNANLVINEPLGNVFKEI